MQEYTANWVMSHCGPLGSRLKDLNIFHNHNLSNFLPVFLPDISTIYYVREM